MAVDVGYCTSATPTGGRNPYDGRVPVGFSPPKELGASGGDRAMSMSL